METFEIKALSLSKSEAKEIHRVLSALGEAATVKAVRDFCSPGPVMTAVYTVLAAAVLLVLSGLFMPLIFAAVAALVVVPLQVATARSRWSLLLPKEHDAKRVVLG